MLVVDLMGGRRDLLYRLCVRLQKIAFFSLLTDALNFHTPTPSTEIDNQTQTIPGG